jgi:hypothetical protein
MRGGPALIPDSGLTACIRATGPGLLTASPVYKNSASTPV